MKFGTFTPKPGDLFTWHYDSDDAAYNGTIYVSEAQKTIIGDGINLLISLTCTHMCWTSAGQFAMDYIGPQGMIHPRKKVI